MRPDTFGGMTVEQYFRRACGAADLSLGHAVKRYGPDCPKLPALHQKLQAVQEECQRELERVRGRQS